MLGALGVRTSFSGSSGGGVRTFLFMCCSMTSQAAAGATTVKCYQHIRNSVSLLYAYTDFK